MTLQTVFSRTTYFPGKGIWQSVSLGHRAFYT